MASRQRIRSTAIAALVAIAIGLGCGSPLVMLPGGELSGNVKPVPTDWSFSDAFEDVQLETRPADPYSVNVWGVGIGSRFYIASGRGMDSAWAQHIEADPRVRVRIGEDVFELRAVRTEDAGDRERFLGAAKRKYDGFEPDEEQAAKAVLFALGPR